MVTKHSTAHIFNLNIYQSTFREAIDMLSVAAEHVDQPARVVVTPNVDHLVRLSRTPEFQQRYRTADFIFADGMPVVWASRLLGQPLPERVTGADLFVAICEQAVKRQWRVALLGGQPGTEIELAQRFSQYYPGLDIHIIAPSMQFDPYGKEGHQVAHAIGNLQPHVVFACLGMPKQENWALHYAPGMPAGIILCVGAAMEFALGIKKRAPRLFQRIGLEWLWRLLSNPGRLWRRYLVDDPAFVKLVWREWKTRKGNKTIQ